MKPEKLTQEYLKKILSYDPKTGIFTRTVRTGTNAPAGVIAGGLDVSSGYHKIKIRYKTYSAHRLAFLYMVGYFPENHVDHIDRDRANNKWNNLREISCSCNSRNGKVRTVSPSGITGVNKYKPEGKGKPWKVQINTPQKVFLGCFDNLLDAAKARWEAEVKYGYPNCNTTSSAYLYLKEHQAI